MIESVTFAKVQKGAENFQVLLSVLKKTRKMNKEMSLNVFSKHV
jgi:hypothetical protein